MKRRLLLSMIPAGIAALFGFRPHTTIASTAQKATGQPEHIRLTRTQGDQYIDDSGGHWTAVRSINAVRTGPDGSIICETVLSFVMAHQPIVTYILAGEDHSTEICGSGNPT